jgi:actin-related protein 5
MKTIATLAAEDAAGPAKKRKKGGEKDDGFGRDDSDWAVYREVVSRTGCKNKTKTDIQGGEEDSDAEEDDQTHRGSATAVRL